MRHGAQHRLVPPIVHQHARVHRHALRPVVRPRERPRLSRHEGRGVDALDGVRGVRVDAGREGLEGRGDEREVR